MLYKPISLFLLPFIAFSFTLLLFFYITSPFLSSSSTATLSSSIEQQVQPTFTHLDILQRLLFLPTSSRDLSIYQSTCPPSYTLQSNPDQISGSLETWKELLDNSTEISSRRQSLFENVKQMIDRGGYLEKYKGHGKGIVTTAGNANTFQTLRTTLRMIQRMTPSSSNSKISIEIFTYESEIPSESFKSLFIKDLKNLDVRWKRVEGEKKVGVWKNFQIKPESILKSEFETILYLDSDSIPLLNVDEISNILDQVGKGEVVKGGAVFWPDLTRDGPTNPIYSLLGIPCTTDFQIDSGAILIDKSGNQGLNLLALILTQAMAKDWEFWFGFSGGDKDAFRYSFYALDIPFTRAPHWLSSAGVISNEQDERFCGHTMLQYSFLPPSTSSSSSSSSTDTKSHNLPLFVHANLLKHVYIPSPPIFGHIKRLKNDRVDDESTMKRVRSQVWKTDAGTMCVDLWLEGEVKGKEEVVIEKWDEAFGGILKGWEKIWKEEGGRSGGF